jgi:tRNA-2-methylthio-N6-dimethylallyladenosine synthase
MRGCNYSCSYCIVPAVRGREIYRASESILSEVRQRVEQGHREVMLLGQTVNSYRPAPEKGETAQDFADLLRAVDRVPGLRRLRFMSPHPFYVNARMVNAMAECRTVCPHLHLPVQSGSDAMLKRMRRNYTRADYLRRLEELRAAVPGIAVTTDFIVGFPGETEADFAATLSLAREADLDGAYCFKYSPRPGTDAAALPDDVPRLVKEERHARLLELTESLSRGKVDALRGSSQEVMVEAVDKQEDAPLYEGRTLSSRKVFFASKNPFNVGDVVRVDITDTSGRNLLGRLHSAAAEVR